LSFVKKGKTINRWHWWKQRLGFDTTCSAGIGGLGWICIFQDCIKKQIQPAALGSVSLVAGLQPTSKKFKNKQHTALLVALLQWQHHASSSIEDLAALPLFIWQHFVKRN